MAFFQDLGKKISNVAQDASKKTGDMIEIGKLNAAISSDKKAIEDLYHKIGAAVYHLHTAGENLPDALTADLQAVTGKQADIAALEQKIADIKVEEEKAKEAESASAAQPSPAAAEAEPAPAPAASAAAAETPAAPEASQTVHYCTGCGAVLEPGMRFCGSCGQKV
ncbi:MAG: zinc ribbon domain-containing protein [Clostridiaceae bacterium]|nr:zinc ribbon domain-containing protein [Clostridiaceae bacterium]